MGLTVGTGVVGGSVDGSVWKQLQVTIFDEHLNLSGGTANVRQVGAAFTPCCRIVFERWFRI